MLFGIGCGEASADFRLCNNTTGKVGIALGYKDNEGWVTEGWWNLGPRSCETLLRGTLVARYYYVYAIDYDRGGEWSGKAFMCSREKEFTIRGTEDCLARGFDRTGLFRGRYRRAEVLDCAIDRNQRSVAAPERTIAHPAANRHAAPAQPDTTGKPTTMRRQRRTKIVATLGPASSDRAVIRRLFEAGADVFRINMSHTPHDKMRELIAIIRSIEQEYGRPIGILVDLQGPKLRLGTFGGGSAMLSKGETFMLDSERRTRRHLPASTCRIRKSCRPRKPGQTLLLDDGKVRLRCTRIRTGTADHAASRSAASCPTARASACRRRCCRSPRSPPRTGPTSKPRSTPASTGSRCRSSSGPRTSPRCARSRADAR